jgi:release factor glutamine methyltransferase
VTADTGDTADAGHLSWSALAAQARVRLERAGVENATAEARWIVEQAAGMDDGALSVEGDAPATSRGVQQVDRMVERRRAGEPLQYVLGNWAFRSLDLMVDARVLIPRPETEQVVERALDELAALCPPGGRSPVVVDLGTGSGAIGLAVAAERRDAVVVLTDRSAGALEVARSNLAGLGMAGSRVELALGSWFDALDAEHTHYRGAIDLVICNPPYVASDEHLPAEVADHEPHDALVAGPLGTEDLEAVLDAAPRWLRPGGAVVLECAPHQAESLAGRALDVGYASATAATDLTGRLRMVVAHTAGGSQDEPPGHL